MKLGLPQKVWVMSSGACFLRWGLFRMGLTWQVSWAITEGVKLDGYGLDHIVLDQWASRL